MTTAEYKIVRAEQRRLYAEKVARLAEENRAVKAEQAAFMAQAAELADNQPSTTSYLDDSWGDYETGNFC